MYVWVKEQKRNPMYSVYMCSPQKWKIQQMHLVPSLLHRFCVLLFNK